MVSAGQFISAYHRAIRRAVNPRGAGSLRCASAWRRRASGDCASACPTAGASATGSAWTRRRSGRCRRRFAVAERVEGGAERAHVARPEYAFLHLADDRAIVDERPTALVGEADAVERSRAHLGGSFPLPRTPHDR